MNFLWWRIKNAALYIILLPLLPWVLWRRRKKRIAERGPVCRCKPHGDTFVVGDCEMHAESLPDPLPEEPSGFEWQGRPIEALDDAHLWNILKAIERGFWKTYETPVRIKPDLEAALKKEGERRNWNGRDRIRFQQRNLAYENAEQRKRVEAQRAWERELDPYGL